jgi:hypothetical protein
MRMSGLLLVPLAMVAFVAGAQARSAAAVTTADDVRELGAQIELLHPDPFRSVSRLRFQSQLNALAGRAPTLSSDELLVGILRIITLLGPRNGHTGLFPADPANTRELHLYPLRLYDFSDGLFVVDAVDKTLVRSRLVAIEGMPVEEVLARVRPLVSRDNDSNLRGMTPHYLLTAEVLSGLGIADETGPTRFTLERPTGERVDASLSPIRASAYVSAFADPLYGHYPSLLPSASRPLYLSQSAKPLWTRALADGHVIYVGYNAVRAPTRAMLGRIGRLVRGAHVRRVVVDVRRNGGGDNTTYGPLLALFGSPPGNARGRLYLLTGRATFSAAANFAAEMDRDTRTTIIGEPTGGGVETYGDTVPVTLPTLGWTVHVATRYHERKKGSKDRRLAVEPDVRVEPSSTQYFARRDPVLERVLAGL